MAETSISLAAGQTAPDLRSGAARNCMACKRSPARIDPAVPGWPIRCPPSMPRG